MLGLCWDKTYVKITNHDDGYDRRDNNVNKEKNKDDNAASWSGSDGPIFDPIETPWSGLGIVEEEWATMVVAMWPRRHMYLWIGIYIPYKSHSKYVPYLAVYKNWRFWLMLLQQKKNSWINRKIYDIFEIYYIILLIDWPYFSLILNIRCPKQPIAKASKTVLQTDALRYFLLFNTNQLII